MGVPPVILFHAQGEDTMSGVRNREPAAAKQRMRGIDRHVKTLNPLRPSLPETPEFWLLAPDS